MTNTKYLALTAAVAALVGLPVAGANAETNASGKTASSAQFKSVDADKSGTLSQSEFSKLNLGASFQSLDTNSDSVLTLSELNTPAQPKAADDASVGESTTSNGGY